MAGMTLSKDLSSNEHETNSMKKHIDKSQEVRSIVVDLVWFDIALNARFLPLRLSWDINLPLYTEMGHSSPSSNST